VFLQSDTVYEVKFSFEDLSGSLTRKDTDQQRYDAVHYGGVTLPPIKNSLSSVLGM
jgi:hypothetical protein